MTEQERAEARRAISRSHMALEDAEKIIPWLRNSLDREEQLIRDKEAAVSLANEHYQSLRQLTAENKRLKDERDYALQQYEKYAEALKGTKTTNMGMTEKIAEQAKEIQRLKGEERNV